MAPETRRLAAVMFTDIVGYTALTQRNEAHALELLNRHNVLLRPFFPRYRGREVKAIGDSFLVEFDSALDAVRCAVDAQRFLREYNRSAGEDERIRIRIGIHLGDVVHADGDVFGDAVNLASRIEPLADPEGICVSDAVYHQVRNKAPFDFEKLDPRELKNVRYPFDVYRLVDVEPAAQPVRGSPAPTRIAVLPLANISPDPGDAYFADGMTDELISTLSRIGGLRVISRTSVMRYRNTAKGIREIATELNVGSLLEGSVRKVADELRITAQLIDAATDEHLWSEEYDTRLKDVFRIQREIATHVAQALEVRLLSAESRDLGKTATASEDAYLVYLKGRQTWYQRTKEANARAVALFEEAARLDHGFALAYAGLADAYIVYGDWGWMDPRRAFPRAKGHILRALELDPNLAEAYASLAVVYNSFEGNWSESEKAFRRSIELKPSYALAHMWYALLLTIVERFAEALQEIERARDLDPLWWIVGLNRGSALSYLGRREDAITQFRETIAEVPQRPEAHILLGQELLLASRPEEALGELRVARALPGGSLSIKVDLVCLLAQAGRREEAAKLWEDLEAARPGEPLGELERARALFSMNRLDEGFEALRRAPETGSVYLNHASGVVDLRTRPWFEQVRADPRWRHFEESLPGLHRSPRP